MSLRLFTDSSANLPEEILTRRHIDVLSFTLTINGQEQLCFQPGNPFDAYALYRKMREDRNLRVHTSMINQSAFFQAFESCLAENQDVLYLAMSSGASGTYAAACQAAASLRETYRDRDIVIVDTLAASLGEGLQVLEAANLRDAGRTAREIAEILNERRMHMRQFFVVDDLTHLQRGGRLSGAAAHMGTLLHIKPILKGSVQGRIVLEAKVVGRKKALNTLVNLVGKFTVPCPREQTIGIAHGGCWEEAKILEANLHDRYGFENILNFIYEPCTGAHVGPGALALFFFTQERKDAQQGSFLAAASESVKSRLERKVRAKQDPNSLAEYTPVSYHAPYKPIH